MTTQDAYSVPTSEAPRPNAAEDDSACYPCHHAGCPHYNPASPSPCLPEPVSPKELLTQKLAGGFLMLILVSINFSLWGADGTFKLWFALYTVWALYCFGQFAKASRI